MNYNNSKGGKNGVQANLRSYAPASFYIHCLAHVLNLSLCRSVASSNGLIVFEFLKKLAAFFHSSAKRTKILERSVEAYPETTRRKVPSLSDTRWVQRHDSINAFFILIKPIIDSLTEINATDPSESSRMEAAFLLNYLSSTDFQMHICMIRPFMELLYPLTMLFQAKTIDLYKVICLRILAII